MTELFLSGVDREAMRALAFFRYMTVKQFIRAGVARDEKNLRKRLDILRRARLIARVEKNKSGGIGLPCLHFLTKNGVKLLNEHGDIGILATETSRNTVSLNDVAHRVGVVDMHIAFESWATATRTRIYEVQRYFEGKAQGNAKAPLAATALSWGAGDGWEAGKLIPDMMAVYQRRADSEPRGIILEYERGGQWGTHKHFLSKLEFYENSVRAEAPEEHLRVNKGVRIAVVCSSEDMMNTILAKFPRKTDPLWEGRLFFKSREKLDNFAASWKTVLGIDTNLF